MHLIRIKDRFINLDHVLEGHFRPAGVAEEGDPDLSAGRPYEAKLTLVMADPITDGDGIDCCTITLHGPEAEILVEYMTKQAATLNPRTPPKRIPPAPVAAGTNTTSPAQGKEQL